VKRSQRVKRIKAQNKILYRRTQIEGEAEKSAKFLYFLLFLFIAGFSYLIFFSGIFEIKDIEIEGNNIQEEEALKQKVEQNLSTQFLKNNFLLFDKKILAYQLTTDFVFKDVEVKKKFPDRIIIRVEEFQPRMQWKTGNDYYLLDERGKTILKTTNIRENLPLVSDKKNIEVGVGKSIVSPDFINFIIYVNDNFETYTGKVITSMAVSENLNEITLDSGLNYSIYFDTTRDPEVELSNLLTVMEMLKDKSLSYIDLRIKNKVFYK